MRSSAPDSSLFCTAGVDLFETVVEEHLVDRVGGLAFAVGNTGLKPGGATSEDLVSGAIQGFGGGASGPSSGASMQVAGNRKGEQRNADNG